VQTIIALGLGSGRWEELTVAGQALLETGTTAYFRTLNHPATAAIRQRYPHLIIHSFDHLYASTDLWNTLYSSIADELCSRARVSNTNEPLLYAVPGHPWVDDASVRLLRVRTQEQGIPLQIIAGLSSIELALTALDIEQPANLQLLDGIRLAGSDRSQPAEIPLPTRPILITQVHHPRILSAVKATLTNLYPDDWSVHIVTSTANSAAGDHACMRTTTIALSQLDYHNLPDHPIALYLPPLPLLEAPRTAEALRYIVGRLRGPGGCPWDRQQTHRSLKPFVLEEAYEVADALDDGDPAALAEELGDLLLQVYLHAEIAREANEFTLEDVFEHIARKLIRRHPHVFGDVQVRDADHVLRNWEIIKRAERQAKGEDVASESVLRPIPRHVPALAHAYELQRQAAKAGFDWPNERRVLAKIQEELTELTATDAEQEEELGDLLFALAGLARWRQIDPEDALRAASRKFQRRFQTMEQLCRARGQRLDELTAEQWHMLWREAKQADHSQAGVIFARHAGAEPGESWSRPDASSPPDTPHGAQKA